MLPPHTIYKFCVENLRSLDTALVQLKRTAHEAISSSNNPLEKSITRLFALALGSWAEVRLFKLLYEKNGFSSNDRQLIHSKSQQLCKWESTIEIAVRSHYRIPTGQINLSTLPHSIFTKYETLLKILNEDLKPLIEMRNKLAHGQWIYPFSESLELAVPQKTAIENENILSLQFKHSMLQHLSKLIHDLVVSKPTYERDFDSHFRKFYEAKQHLKNRSFQKYCDQLQKRYLTGREKRKINLQNQ